MSFLFIAIFEDTPSATPQAEAAAVPHAQAQAAAAPISQFQAKASEDNGATGKATMRRADSMTGEASRVDAGRTASATSENGRDSLERQALNSSSALTSSRATGKPEAVTPPPSRAPILKPLSKADQIRLLRPECKHADDLAKCGGSGRRHCRDCEVESRADGGADIVMRHSNIAGVA